MSCPDEALGAFPITDANPVGTHPRESAAFALAQAEFEGRGPYDIWYRTHFE